MPLSLMPSQICPPAAHSQSRVALARMHTLRPTGETWKRKQLATAAVAAVASSPLSAAQSVDHANSVRLLRSLTLRYSHASE